MRSKFLILIALFIAAGFVLFAFTRTIRFTEAGVISTFGKASEQSVITEPGLRFRWPAPIQSVTVYDTRARLLSTRSETQQTADNRQIIVEAFLTWQVDDPLLFYQRFSGAGAEERRHYAAAENTLRSQLRSALSEVSRYRLDELFSAEPGASKLAELEEAIFARLAESSGDDGAVEQWGVRPMLVGINRIVLPQDTTKDVFERMRATQQRLASEAQSRGESVATTIKDAAKAAAGRIISFAERRAAEIRVRGDIEATEWVAKLQEEPELAIFLEQTNNLENFYGNGATLVLPTDMPGMGVFNPFMLSKLNANGLPPFAGEPDNASDSPASVAPAADQDNSIAEPEAEAEAPAPSVVDASKAVAVPANTGGGER